MKTNCILICAGEQIRWNNYLQTNKHLINVNNERLIDRTVRLIHEYFDDTKIYVVAKTDEYIVPNSELYVPTLNSNNGGLDKFLSSSNLWDTNARNIIFYGDIWLSENGMKIISNVEKEIGFYLEDIITNG